MGSMEASTFPLLSPWSGVWPLLTTAAYWGWWNNSQQGTTHHKPGSPYKASTPPKANTTPSVERFTGEEMAHCPPRLINKCPNIYSNQVEAP